MEKFLLEDSSTHLKFIVEDLKAIQAVIATIEGEKKISCEREALQVVFSALCPIIADAEEVIQTLDTELEKEDGTG